VAIRSGIDDEGGGAKIHVTSSLVPMSATMVETMCAASMIYTQFWGACGTLWPYNMSRALRLPRQVGVTEIYKVTVMTSLGDSSRTHTDDTVRSKSQLPLKDA